MVKMIGGDAHYIFAEKCALMKDSDILFRKSRVTGEMDMDSVAASKRMDTTHRAYEVLLMAQRYWSNMDKFRRERDRCKRYTYGDQWGDVIDVDGHRIKESEYIKAQGKAPLKNNLIRRLVKNVLGVFRSQSKEPTCTARDRDEQKLGEMESVLLQANMQINRMPKLNARMLEEFLISGLAVQKRYYGWFHDRADVWTENVQLNSFFVDNVMRDTRGWDVSCIGELHDVTFGQLCAQFAHSKEDYATLRHIYGMAASKSLVADNVEKFGYSSLRNLDFFCPDNPTLCRVIEVWRKERKPRLRCHDWNTGDVYKIDIADKAELVDAENEDRIARGTALGLSEDDIPLIDTEWYIDEYWYYYFLSPFGDILDEGETPYEHGEHPYTFSAYPMIDGEIHSFVSDVIDQQRYVNRLVTMWDWIMSSSAKGVLLFPEDQLPEGSSLEDIADEWTRFNGVIAIKAKAGAPLPQQISANSTNIGINELLQMQLKFFEDISGVNGALQGKPGYAGMSGVLYAQQTQNSTTSLLDIMEDFSDFIVTGAYKTVELMQQYYEGKRVVTIAGKRNSVVIDPEMVRNVKFDLSITESTTSPVYRQYANEVLLEFWRAGQVPLKLVLENGDFAFADNLLQGLDAMEEQMQQMQAQQAAQPQQMQGGDLQGAGEELAPGGGQEQTPYPMLAKN